MTPCRSRVSVLVAVLCAAVVLSGCGPRALETIERQGAPRQETKSRPVTGIVGAIDEFGFELLGRVSDEASGNAVISPVSVHAVLAMTATGANGETADQMRRVLRTDAMTPDEANSQWGTLLQSLGKRDSAQTLHLANALWAREGIKFRQPFLDANRDHFGAQISTLDFENENVASAVNAWVSKATKGMIQGMLDEVDPNAVLILANAAYFKGDWADPFTKEATYRAPFTRGDGTKVDVDMMRTTTHLPYAQDEMVQATKLTYEGGDTALYVMLPKPGIALEAAREALGAGGFGQLRRALESTAPTEVSLELPKLDVEYSTDLVGPLAAMGMPLAFDSSEADFSKISAARNVWLSRVSHATRIKVDEKGTEAAAATVAQAPASAAPSMTMPPVMICDRPYAFAIVDEKSGVVLFLGAVNDPNQ